MCWQVESFFGQWLSCLFVCDRTNLGFSLRRSRRKRGCLFVGLVHTLPFVPSLPTTPQFSDPGTPLNQEPYGEFARCLRPGQLQWQRCHCVLADCPTVYPNHHHRRCPHPRIRGRFCHDHGGRPAAAAPQELAQHRPGGVPAAAGQKGLQEEAPAAQG